MSRFGGSVGGGTPWNQALTNYARTPDPSTLPAEVLVMFDDKTVAIWDAFRKAQYHALVLPRLPYTIPKTAAATAGASMPSLSLTNGKLTSGLSSSGIVPASHLRSLRSLLASPYASAVLQALRIASDRVASHIHHRMRTEHVGKQWRVRRGFHAIPSMEHVHLHVISDDLVSDRLKNKKHYQSFHPTHGFWLDLDEVETYIANKGLPRPDSYYESLLRSPLVSFHNQQPFSNIPALKTHLERAWHDQLDALPILDPPCASIHKRKALSSSASPTESSKRHNATAELPDAAVETEQRGSDTETEPEPEVATTSIKKP
ncbi:aprataxin-like protein [Thecaphora frezii]